MPDTAVPEHVDYDHDPYAWAVTQARLLLAQAASRPNEPIDWAHLAEEVDDMARRHKKSCESFLRHVIAHLLKIHYARDAEPVPHWQAEVRGFRRNLREDLTPSLTRMLRDRLADLYADAREDAVGAMWRDPTFWDRPPRACPYDWEQITGDWWPERAGAGPAAGG
jgi:oligoendopeptidase F